jgi:hypothetical protein
VVSNSLGLVDLFRCHQMGQRRPAKLCQRPHQHWNGYVSARSVDHSRIYQTQAVKLDFETLKASVSEFDLLLGRWLQPQADPF